MHLIVSIFIMVSSENLTKTWYRKSSQASSSVSYDHSIGADADKPGIASGTTPPV